MTDLQLFLTRLSKLYNATNTHGAPCYRAPAFSPALRGLGTVVATLVILQSLATVFTVGTHAMPAMGLALAMGANVIVAITVYYLWRSYVQIDADGIYQTWVFPKQVKWEHVEYVKTINIPGARRLVVRIKNGGAMGFLRSFNAGDPQLAGVYKEIALLFPVR